MSSVERSVETRLVELGEHLDYPDGAELGARVALDLAELSLIPRISDRAPHPQWRRLVALLATAAVVAAIAIEPSRRALADLFRIGGVEVRNAQDLHPPSSAPSATTATIASTTGRAETPLAAAQAAVEFPIRLPNLVPSRTPNVSVDLRVPGGLVVLDYGDFRLVEVAAPDGPPVLAKGLAPNTRMALTTVGDTTGYWFTGTHHLIAYLDRDGNIRQDTVREVGHVLLWAADGVTYRIEGFPTLAGAQEVAATIT